MNTWFEVKVKYVKVCEDGKEKKVTESFLFDAVSWTDAETRTTEEMKQIISGDFVIDDIKKSKLSEVFPYDSGEWWFKIGVDMVTVDEQAGKEKKTKLNYLIMADDMQEVLNRMNESLDSMIVPFVISSMSVSNIIDVFPYFENKNEIVKN